MQLTVAGCTHATGLLALFFVQPALLYLVPACIGVPLAVAVVKGEVGRMFR